MALPLSAESNAMNWAKTCFDLYIAPTEKGFSDVQVAELVISLIENALCCRPEQHKVLMPRLRAVVNRFDKATASDGEYKPDTAVEESDEDGRGKPDNRFVAVQLLKKPASFNAYCAAVPIDDPAELSAALDFQFQELNMQKRSKKTEQDGDETKQDGDETEQDGDESEQDGDESEQDGDESEQDGDESEQDGGETEQYGGETEQDGDETEQDGDETEQDGGETEQDGDETDEDEKYDAKNTKEKNTSAFPAEARSKPRQTGLRKQVMQMEDVVGTIDTYLENNPLKDRESVINAVVLTFRQYLDHINASEGKLADKGYVRFAVALEFALKAHDPVEYAKVAYETLHAFVSIRGRKTSLNFGMDFTGATKQTADLIRYSDNGVDLPALSQALIKLRATQNMDRLVRMVWAMDCYQLLQFFDATVETVKRDMELCRENKASGTMRRQLPLLIKSQSGRSISSLVIDHLVNLNLNPGRAHDEYAANQTRECLAEARNVGRAVSVITKARGKDEVYENPGLIFAWLLGDKGANRMHASRLSATAQVAFDIILNHVATDPLFDGEVMRTCHHRLFEIVTLRINTNRTERPLPIEQSLSMLRSTISSPADLYAALIFSKPEPGSRLVEVYDTPKKLRDTGEEFRVHQGGLIYPQSHAQSPMPKVPTVAERNTAMQEQHTRGSDSNSE